MLTEVKYSFCKCVLSKFICRSAVRKTEEFPYRNSGINYGCTVWQDGPQKPTVALCHLLYTLLLPPPLPFLLTRQTSHHMRSHCHHLYYSVLITASIERGGKGLVLQSKPTSFFISTASAMKPHTLWGLQRNGPPARKLKGPSASLRILGPVVNNPCFLFSCPARSPS